MTPTGHSIVKTSGKQARDQFTVAADQNRTARAAVGTSGGKSDIIARYTVLAVGQTPTVSDQALSEGEIHAALFLAQATGDQSPVPMLPAVAAGVMEDADALEWLGELRPAHEVEETNRNKTSPTGSTR